MKLMLYVAVEISSLDDIGEALRQLQTPIGEMKEPGEMMGVVGERAFHVSIGKNLGADISNFKGEDFKYVEE